MKKPLGVNDRCVVLPVRGTTSPNVGFTVTITARRHQCMEFGQWWDVKGQGLRCTDGRGGWRDSDTITLPSEALQRIDPPAHLLPATSKPEAVAI